ncbi:DUF397 domain-containing protein [Saccharopolyspora sp. SCSIO 74807]|uniref:DUF397 domain-containing protein n=1 Tax=Saccharopolyspora sp. SCSIO 74807 TaxID=3118084 RepID=UPI0030D39560
MTSNNASTARRDSPIGVWFKSSRSNPNGNQCVEVCFGTDLVHIRDSKDRGAGPVLSVPAGHWTRFLDEVVGRVPANSNAVINIVIGTDGRADLHARTSPGKTLSYTPGEWSAFVEGVRNAEFDLASAEKVAA